MTPFYFGPEERRLFGVLHRVPGSGRGVVLVPPFGQEALRSHRTLRILAESWARAGWNALRFDPYGTGDSAGDDLDVTLAGMASDARLAAAELAAATQARQLAVFGMRLGGLVALSAADAFKAVVLWEPLVDDDVRALGNAGYEHEGFRIAPELRRELRDYRLPTAGLPKRGLLVWNAAARGDRVTQALGGAVERLETRVVPAPPAWNEENDFGAGPIPAAVIDALASWRG